MSITIPDDVAQRLQDLAERKDIDIGDLLRDLLARYPAERDGEQKPWATLADLGRNAKEAGLASPEPVDTARRSREILNAEYADYLKRRINR